MPNIGGLLLAQASSRECEFAGWVQRSARRGATLVVVVSDALARVFWPNQNPLGKRIKLGRVADDAPFVSVVGVVGDVQQLDLVRTPRPAMYFAASQDAGTGDTLQDWVLDTGGVPVTRLQTMDDIRSSAMASQRFNLQVIAFFTLFGLALASVGVYGVTAYSVSQRTRELGTRVALVASPDALLQLVVGHGVALAAAGLVLGMSAAAFMTSLMSSLLFGISARDPLAFAASGLLLLIVSVVASLVPARRAVRIEAGRAAIVVRVSKTSILRHQLCVASRTHHRSIQLFNTIRAAHTSTISCRLKTRQL